jgi:hypothetical protein
LRWRPALNILIAKNLDFEWAQAQSSGYLTFIIQVSFFIKKNFTNPTLFSLVDFFITVLSASQYAEVVETSGTDIPSLRV